MKGLNIKRIAAIGLGAALVGSALAPVVSAANVVPTGLDELGRDTVITATGAPAVDIVVGANAAVSDVVWAGNIAARVAQLATKPVTCTAEAGTVDLTVGGTTSIAGSGVLEEVDSDDGLDLTKNTVDITGMEVTSTKMPSLVNDLAAEWTINGSTKQKVDIKERLYTDDVDVYVQSTNSSTAYAFGDMVAKVPAGKVRYVVSFTGQEIKFNQTNMDSNSQVDVEVPFLGKTYVVDEVSSTGDSMILYADTTPTDVEVGQKLPVTPASGYAGKTMEIQLVDLIQIGSGNENYQPKWALLIDGVAQKYVQKNADTAYDLKDEFGKSYFTNNIYVTGAGLNLSANKYTATIRSGSERLELVNGEGFPFTDDPDVDDAAQWKVVLEKSDTGTGITSVSLVNQWAYIKDSGTQTDTSKYVLKVGEEIILPENFAKFKFMGFQDKPKNDVVLGEKNIEFKDIKGNNISVPYYQKFELNDKNKVVVGISGKDYTFWVENTDSNVVAYKEGNYKDATSTAGWATADFNNINLTANVPVQLDLGLQNSSGNKIDVNYLFVYEGGTRTEAALVLDGAQRFEVYTDGTDRAYLTFSDSNSGLPYFLPNFKDFEEVLASFTHNDDVYMDANFLYTALDGSYAQVFMRSGESAMVWGYEELQDKSNVVLNGPTYDAISNGLEISEHKNDLKTILMNDGSSVTTDGDNFVISVPEKLVAVEAYLGSTGTSTTTTGGKSYKDVSAKETRENVRIDAVNCGAGSSSAVEIVPVSNLVKTAKGSGKSIIVGGWVANAAAANLEVNAGNTLEKLLINSGDYVAAVLASGDIVVAGFNGNDTGRAAQDLITALEGLM